jgi:TnpA family transposase
VFDGPGVDIGYAPIAAKGVPALERRRMGHVEHTYLRADNYTAANPHLVAKQAGIGFAQALGGGLVAAIDGMRFVVPVPSLFARPNRKFFGPKRGMTLLNMIFRAVLQRMQHWTFVTPGEDVQFLQVAGC